MEMQKFNMVEFVVGMSFIAFGSLFVNMIVPIPFFVVIILGCMLLFGLMYAAKFKKNN